MKRLNQTFVFSLLFKIAFLMFFVSNAIFLLAQNLPQPPELIPYRKPDYHDKWGFCDRNKKIVIECKYVHVEPFYEDLALVASFAAFGFIDKTGKEVIPLKYNYAESFKEGLAKVNVGGEFDILGNFSGGKWGFVDKTGKEVIPLKYDAVGDLVLS